MIVLGEALKIRSMPGHWEIPWNGWAHLNDRQVNILKGIAEGQKDIAIRAELLIPIQTWKGDIKKIYAAFDGNSRGHLVALAFQVGLFVVGETDA